MNAVASRNIKFVSHSDQGGRGDGVQVMVHRGYAYIGHGFSNGITTIDVRDARHPRVVDFIACPSGTRALKIVPGVAPPPIFSAIRKLPSGVFMLPSSVPIPKRELETG